MGSDNVELVRHGYEDLARTGEIDLALIDPEVEWDNSGAIFDGAVYHGHEGVRAFFERSREMWDHQRFEPQEFIEGADDRVVVVQRIRSVGRDGIETIARNAVVLTLREGRIVHMKSFQTKAEALAAARQPR
jgi:ketosteroid isomerase-like protein